VGEVFAEEVAAVPPETDDWVELPAPELPHPDNTPIANIAETKHTAFIIDFIISPLSVVAPFFRQQNAGDVVSSERYFGDPAVSVRPLGFPSHPRGWFSIVVYLLMQAQPAT
jgi:hypothetical protein